MTHSLSHTEEVLVKGFKFQATQVLLTYKTHLPKEYYITWLKAKIPDRIKFIRLAHEKGDNNPEIPYEHTHVLIEFSKRFVTENARFFDYKNIIKGYDCQRDEPTEKLLKYILILNI